MKNIIAAALTFIIIMQCLLAFPLSAGGEEAGGIIVAVLGDGFAGADDPYFKPPKDFSGPLTKDAAGGKGLYINARFPYAYDYAGADTEIKGFTSSAMTACDIIVKQAPDVQVALMKIYDDKGEPDYGAACAAMRDALELGAAVILLDIDEYAGSDSGKELPEDVTALIAQAEECGVTVVCAAGNNGMSGTHSVYRANYGIAYPSAALPDTGTVSAPSSIASVISAGSRESTTYTAPCLTFGANGKTTFTDTTSMYGIAGNKSFASYFDGRTLDYVPVGGTGTPDDCAAAGSLDGKLALIMRGELTFVEKVNNAADAGAAGVIIYDNIENNIDNVLMSLEGAAIPAVFIPYESGMAMIAETDRRVHIKDGETALFAARHGGIISPFSSRGVTPSLQIKPELVAEGGSLDITVFGDKTKRSTGNDTLYSAASLAAAAASLAGYFRESGIGYDAASLKLALMNAAEPVKDIFGMEYSPRAQGAGAVDIENAKNSDSRLFGADGTGKISLGDRLGTSFPITFTVENITGKKMTYSLSATVAGDDYTYFYIGDDGLAVETDSAAGSEPGFPAFINGNARAFRNASVTLSDIQKNKTNLNTYSASFKAASVTLDAGERRTITLLCSLDRETADEYGTVFTNGYFIDGYIRVTSGEGNVSSLPYTGFCGDFGNLQIIDTSLYERGSYYDSTFFYSTINEYGLDIEVPLGYNIYNEDIVFGSDLVAFSPNGDGYADNLSLAFTLLRSAADLRITVTAGADGTGGDLFTLFTKGGVKKSNSGSASVGKYRVPVWNGKAEDNKYYTYPDGRYTLTISAVPGRYGAAVQKYSMPFVLDTAAPVLDSYEIISGENGERMLTAEISDGHYIQSAKLYSAGDDVKYESVQVFGEPSSGISCVFDITDTESEFLYLEVIDYAYNSGTYRINVQDKS